MRNICEGRLLIKECFDCLQLFENNKLFGNDGFIVEFYKIFWIFIGNLFVDFFNYLYEYGELLNI